jgi:hypothetical protein
VIHVDADSPRIPDVDFLSLAVLVVLVLVCAWFSGVILRKAGYSRAYGCLAPVLGPIALVVFALSEWPIQRELAWLRMKAGETTGHPIVSVEQHAFDLERQGEWARAVEVYEELTRRAADEPTAEYYRNNVARLRLRLRIQETSGG